ncbi:MAG: sel1 repeat family protein [Hyphomicrobiaceae bacterium]|nr:sel1 repeat family protein [Hyphomicrobiaceae bacterium]
MSVSRLRFVVIAAILIACLPGTANAASDAEVISDNVLGPRLPVDLAFGAFQRGQYLTALSLALDRVAADRNDAAAETLIARIYEEGLGVPQNYELAASWYKIAADNGDPNAAFALAVLYQNGRGIPRNREQAAELFKQAAAKGHVEAMYNVALLYVEGRYAEPSLTKAAELMKKAADLNLPQAQYDYGTMLMQGAGTFPDAEEGARQIGLAAQNGLTAAEVDYATLLYLGHGVKKDRIAAITWYRRAANLGNAVAQNRLAKLLAAGENVEQDPETAAMYRALARRQGLNDTQTDDLLANVPSDIIARGEERARYWPGDVPTQGAAPGLLPSSDDDSMHEAMQQLIDQGMIDEALMLPVQSEAHSITDQATELLSAPPPIDTPADGESTAPASP